MRHFCSGYIIGLIVLTLLLSQNVVAKTYKCVDEKGHTSYSQTPCATGAKANELTFDRHAQADAEVCAEVRQFAAKVGNSMRRGSHSSEVIARHGGLETISKQALGIINYIYSFRANDTVSVDKIASLSVVKCNNGGFGQVSYADIPGAVDPNSEEGIRARVLEIQRQNSQGSMAAEKGDNKWQVVPDSKTNGLPGRSVVPSIAPQPNMSTCLQYEQQLKLIQKSMRAGYSSNDGERLRAERRKYQELLHSVCK